VRRSVALPQFRPRPIGAIQIAQRAEHLGIDGVFVYDHLWPLGRDAATPTAECLTLVAAVAAATSRIRVGTLALRAGLRPAEVSLAALRTVAEIAPGRLVVAIGTGDAMNREENRRFGIPVAPIGERRKEVGLLANALSEEGIEVWMAGLSRPLREMCAERGLTWNCWELSDEQLQTALSEVPQAHVTWAGNHEPPALTVTVDEVTMPASHPRYASLGLGH
jgi:alkanesulfonate monooxygenase SsuD/methylene tetrahydromethanopterin reductase-like flavin-dependent oxidoreductase (luciferase family)